jgi:hypothetical protein
MNYQISLTNSNNPSFNDFHCSKNPPYLVNFGDAMQPTIYGGDALKIKMWGNLDVVLYGEIYYIVLNANANDIKVIRRVFQHKDNNKLILRADNSNRPDFVVNKIDIKELHIVEGIIRKSIFQ